MKRTQPALTAFVLLFLLFQLRLAEAATAKVTIPVNIAYSKDSLWSETEISKRLEYTNSVLTQACSGFKIAVKPVQILEIRDPDLQDVGQWMSSVTVKRLKQVLSQFHNPVRPVLFYARQAAFEEYLDPSDHLAQAYTLDGPRVFDEHVGLPWNGFTFQPYDPLPFASGILDWNRFEELKDIHGIAVIAQGYSEKHALREVGRSVNDKYSVDVHELGHILLNDGSHRYSPRNIMGAKDRKRFDTDQCLLISRFHEREARRFQAVKAGMNAICSYAEARRIDDRPSYCPISR